MTAIDEKRNVLLEIADLKVHFDIKDGKQWFWQPSKTLKVSQTAARAPSWAVKSPRATAPS